MNNQREIYEALLAGKTLVNKHLFAVKMNKEGMLESNQDKSRGYSALFNTIFDEPEKWEIQKELKWYENIPDGGVLCWAQNSMSAYRSKRPAIITKEEDGMFHSIDDYWSKAFPLTKQEIQVFMDNAPEDTK